MTTSGVSDIALPVLVFTTCCRCTVVTIYTIYGTAPCRNVCALSLSHTARSHRIMRLLAGLHTYRHLYFVGGCGPLMQGHVPMFEDGLVALSPITQSPRTEEPPQSLAVCALSMCVWLMLPGTWPIWHSPNPCEMMYKCRLPAARTICTRVCLPAPGGGARCEAVAVTPYLSLLP